MLVDDGSTDGTGALARALAGERLRVVSGLPRPPGWSGKLWAVRRAWLRARRPLVLLCDADIVHDPAHAATLAAKIGAGLDLVSEMVALNCESPAERALVPAFVFFFQLLYPFARCNHPRRRTAAAAGGTVLVRRAALERIGGIAAVRGALIDDVALAAAVKRGGRIWLGHSQLARSIRPYPEAADVWRMVARTAYVQLRFSPVILAGTVAGLALIWLVPPAAALLGPGWLARGPGCWPGPAARPATSRRCGASACRRCGRWRCRWSPASTWPPRSAPRWTTTAAAAWCGSAASTGEAGLLSVSVEAPSGKGRDDENFPVGSRLIRAALRPHVHAFYDFARNADDIADDPALPSDEKMRRLDLMGLVLIGDAEAGRPSASRLRESLEQTGVSPQHALDLLQAFRQDAVKTRYADWARADGLLPLLRHARRPPRAGPAWRASRHLSAVGRAVRRAAGAQPPAGLRRGPRARWTGATSRRTCWLAAGIGTDAIRRPAPAPALRGVLDALLARTEALNRTGWQLPGRVRDRRLRVETAVIAGLSRRLAAAAPARGPAGDAGEAAPRRPGGQRAARAAELR